MISHKSQIVLRGIWMSALFWPYTHGGGFHNAALLALTPLWLSFGDLWSSWILRWTTWIVMMVAELTLEWASLPSLRHVFITFSRSVLVLHQLSFTNWNQISAHIATPLLLIGALLGWHVFRQANNSRRIATLLVIGIAALAVNHVFWQLPAEHPLFAYAAIGLLLLSSHHVLAPLSRQGSSSIMASVVAALTIFVPLSLGWAGTPRPGHASLGFLGGNLQDLRFLTGTGATTGYSEGINHIGHSIVPNYNPVMIVHSKSPHYWQAEIFNTFTGKEWTNPGSNAVQITPEDSGIPLFSLPFDTSEVSTTTDTITFQAVNGHPFRTLFYPGVPLSFGSRPSSLVLYPNKEHFVSNAISSYRVTSIIPHFNAALLNHVTFGEYPTPPLSQDLQIPSNLSPRVGQLANQITQHASGPWQAALDIKHYLDTHYGYSFHVTPTQHNVVNHFLFNDKVGYCDQFSTAFIMMARSIGIPARWVAGYAPGQYNAHDHGYLVRAIDAHSWAQIYIAPFGWIPIDPTPGFNIPDLSVPKTSSSSSSQTSISIPVTSAVPKVHYNPPPGVSEHTLKTPTAKSAHRVHPSRRFLPVRNILGFLLLPLVILIAVFGIRTRKYWLARDPQSQAVSLWRQIKWWTHFRMRVPTKTLTPREWLALWQAEMTSDVRESRQLVQYLERGLYGPDSWSLDDAHQAQYLWKRLRFAIKKSSSRSQAS
ncbi:transglutaminase-like domain-containing protein [Sulfobacillus thermosulfidooxidans]|uniref:transglutaminase-like domain-containing protein n=1 Tax=Sulfobacillus thermosulfidooxidans TaxID=28034 RepID=UPI00096BCA94|nr:transglutaminase-like domain-containing protein [Sulfobacillus thermosulfidooxidans]OLZ10984.1 hypothetical protein BFX05_09625 [Sulfobacillus thermosulfidooxidans]OLZ14472.1 hypothetical protein BFX06_09450 [Sulfobacillus thermosulfidooxidans]OLZ19215.1 hypothetical protein BFX07_05845 [Sulfobacillus thermosulfidooxidans]